MTYTMYIQGKPYHAEPSTEWEIIYQLSGKYFSPEDDPEEYLLAVTDEEGYPIPKHICICAAHSWSECCCGAFDFQIVMEGV